VDPCPEDDLSGEFVTRIVKVTLALVLWSGIFALVKLTVIVF
jgi:hypothetical protein